MLESFYFEIGWLILSLAGIFIIFKFKKGWHERWEKYFQSLIKKTDRFSRRTILIGICLGTSAFIYFLIPTLLHKPWQDVHDESSYLLAADTFASGRLTNPTHPLYPFFETFHIIQKPSYASMYPPGQGLTLALGQVLTGHPIIGVNFIMALAAVAIFWMLLAWTPLFSKRAEVWAFLGALIFILKFGGFHYWNHSYMGGGLAVLGGALVYGAFPRIMASLKIRDTVLLVLGFFILANSRPFEGFIFCLPVCGLLLYWLIRDFRGLEAWRSIDCANKTPSLNKINWRKKLLKFILPVIILSMLGSGWMAYYNYRVTGNPFELPIRLYQKNYQEVRPLFFFLGYKKSDLPAQFRELDRFKKEYLIPKYEKLITLAGWLENFKENIKIFWSHYFGVLLTIPLLTIFWLWKKPKMKFVLLTVSSVLCFILAVTFFHKSHQTAPLTCAFLLITIYGINIVWHFKIKGRAVGALFIQTLMLGVLITALSYFLIYYNTFKSLEDKTRDVSNIPYVKYLVVKYLTDIQGKHVVIVRYAAWHNFFIELIYNKANIDEARIVWARDLGPERNQELLDYYRDRKIWLLEPESPNTMLQLYREANDSLGN